MKLPTFKKTNDRFNEKVLMCDKMHFDAQEAYKLLRTNLLYTLPDKNCRKIGVTSSNRNEGKSTTSINLAYTLSATNNKVLLIDLDLRLPSVASKLEANYTYGIVDYLAGKVPLKRIVHKGQNVNWDIIYSGTIPPTPAELIASDKMKLLIKSLESMYDYIILDLPPVNIVSDALIAKDLTDGYIVVVRENYSDKHSLADCIRQLEFLDSNILGVVLVDSENSSSSAYSRRYHKYGKNYYRYGYGYYGKHLSEENSNNDDSSNNSSTNESKENN